ncbi:tetratricopeptide repeat protein [Patescibacteria group bacterium]
MQNTLNKIIKTSIYLLVFLLPLFFLPFSLEAIEFNKQYLLFFLVSLAFLAWLGRMILVDREVCFKHSPINIFVLVFLFIAILSTVFSVDKFSSIFGFYGSFSNGLIGLISLVMFYFLITNNVEVSEENTRNIKKKISPDKIIKIFLWSVFTVISISYLSVLGIWIKIAEFFSLPSVMLQMNFNTVSGALEGLAVFLAVCSVLLVGLLAERAGKRTSNVFLWFLLISALGLLIIIDFISAWIVLSITLLLFVIFSLRKRVFQENVNWLLIPISLIIISTIFMASSPQKMVFGENSTLSNLPKELNLSQQVSWEVGFKSAVNSVKNGFLGSGISTFSYDFSQFKSSETNQTNFWQIRFSKAGNYISEILATVGFLGLLSYLFLIGVFLLIFWLLIQKDFRKLTLLMVFVALLIGQFIYHSNTVLVFVFWLILGLSVASWQGTTKEKTISFKSFPEMSLVFYALLIILVLIILGSWFFAYRFYLADVNFKNSFSTDRTQNLEKAVKLNPYQSQYKITLSQAYLSEFLNKGEQITPSVDIQLAIIYGKGGEVGQSYIKGATEIAPNSVFAWESMGVVYREIVGLASGALEWGIKSFERAIVLEPTNPILYTELGKLYLSPTLDDVMKAKELFGKATELKSDYVPALIQEALILEREYDLVGAVRKMEQAVNTQLDIEAMFQLGRLYFNNGETNKAITQLENVVLLAPQYSNARYSLGVAYQEKGEIQKAIVEFEKVLELNPENQDIIQKLNDLKGGE